MWGKLKKFVIKHKTKIIAAIGITTLGYCTYQYFKDESSVKLSAFVAALKKGYVEEAVIEGQTIYFKGETDTWF